MRSTGIAIAALLGVGALSAVVMAQSSGQSVLSQYAEKLNKATALNVDFTTHKGEDAPVNYSIALAKPNQARIETPKKLVIADGTNITTYDKAQNSYMVMPQTDEDLKALLKQDEMVLFAPFFDSTALDTASAKDLGAKVHGGQDVEAIQFPLAGKGRSATAYIAKSDGLIHQAQISMKVIDASNNQTAQNQILVARTFSVAGNADSKKFAFVAPDGAKLVTLADMMSDRWYSDINEAEAIAAKTNRKIFVDFMASWCGPCHRLNDEVLVTDNFKKMSKYFVFLRVDVDQQPSVAASYQVEAMPTQLILDAKGTVIDKIVGYGGPEMFYSFINKYTGS